MATNTYEFLQGKGYWVTTQGPDQYGKFGLKFYPNEASYQKILKLKEPPAILNVIGKDEDGYFIRISRPASINTKKGPVALQKPVILDKDGNPFTGLIGNGSDLTLKVQIRNWKRPGTQTPGRSIRLEAIRIDNLIPYEKERDFTEEQKRLAAKLEDAPEPLF
jgi:hypothetical protein